MSKYHLLIVIALCLLPFFQTATAQNSGFAPSNAVEIYYKVFGEGEPLLIINGGPGMNSQGFEGLAEMLSKNFKVILFDQRGTGKSTLKNLSENTITMDLMAEDMEALRSHLKISSWNILGHSFGGLLASHYTSKHPDCVKKLVYSSSGGLDLGFLAYINDQINSKLSENDRALLQHWLQKINHGDTSYYARYQRGLALAPAYIHNKKFVPQLAERLTQGNATINRLVFQDLHRINYDCKSTLSIFKNPVLIIQGKDDIIKEETALITKSTLPQASLVLLENCGHYGWLDRPKTYFDNIVKFLKLTS